MGTRIALVVGAVFGLLLAPAADATYMAWYAYHPVEHDDQGRSIEPDFASTGVLGPRVENRVVDLARRGAAIPDSALAPGCTDDMGRQASGHCGMWTVGLGEPLTGTVLVPPGTVGITGADRCPGRFGFREPGCPAFAFLDAHQNAMALTVGVQYVEVNRKVEDLGLSAVFHSVDGNLGQDMAAGGVAIWSWYGTWQDRNENGVIDHLQTGNQPGGMPVMSPANEFQWLGNCRGFSGAYLPGDHCADEGPVHGPVVMNGFIFPGNHHALCGAAVPGDVTGLTCMYLPPDHPGRQAVCFAEAAGVPTPFLCFGSTTTLDAWDQAYHGDPLLGPQDSVAPDMNFDDYTGDPSISFRTWSYGLGWGVVFYDQSLLVTTTFVTTVGCTPDAASPNRVILASCRFADVDRLKTWSPALEDLLVGTVKPAARSQWVFVRDSLAPLAWAVDGLARHRATDLSPTLGPLDDQLVDPGWSREPNHAGDAYPGAAHNARAGAPGCPPGATAPTTTPLHHGWCNSYAGYQSGSYRAWIDAQAIRTAFYGRLVGVNQCVICTAGGTFGIPYAGEAPAGSPNPVMRADGDHRRTLGPGAYYFVGYAGLWQDRPQTWGEATFDVATASFQGQSYSRGPDGWIGNIVNTTGTWYYRGYADESCATDNGEGVHTYGECHPYLDGAMQGQYVPPQGTLLALPGMNLPVLPRPPPPNPPPPQPHAPGGGPEPEQAPGDPTHGEWQGRCRDDGRPAPTQGVGTIVLEPAGGHWSVPVLVWRNHEALLGPNNPPVVEDRTETPGPITIRVACRAAVADTSGVFVGTDYLILPTGNRGLRITATLEAVVPLDRGLGAERVRDFDVYEAW